MNKQAEKIKAQILALKKKRQTLVNRLAASERIHAEKAVAFAKKKALQKAKFKVGDIIWYSTHTSPMVITEIVAYCGEPHPAYNGYEVSDGHLTMRKVTTVGHGTQEKSPLIGGKIWTKIGHARDLKGNL